MRSHSHRFTHSNPGHWQRLGRQHDGNYDDYDDATATMRAVCHQAMATMAMQMAPVHVARLWRRHYGDDMGIQTPDTYLGPEPGRDD